MSHEGFTMEKGILAFYLPPWRSGGLAGTKVTSTEPHLIRIHDLTPERIPSSNTYVGMVDADDTARERLVQRFRSEHPDLFPAGTPDRPVTEFLDRCAVVFRCTACGSVYHFNDFASHGTECPQSSLGSWSIESITPAKHNIVTLVLRLLEVLELPQAATLSPVTEALKDIRFLCLCGDPRYEDHFDFRGLLDHVISENQEHEEIKSKVLGKTRSRTSRRAVLSDAQLVLLNDHNPDALASKIVRIGREQLGDDGLVGGSTGQSQRIPTRKKWDHCDVCLQLTGTKVYFGGSADFKRYHLTTKHGCTIP